MWGQGVSLLEQVVLLQVASLKFNMRGDMIEEERCGDWIDLDPLSPANCAPPAYGQTVWTDRQCEQVVRAGSAGRQCGQAVRAGSVRG